MSNVRHVLNYAIRFERALLRDWILIRPSSAERRRRLGRRSVAEPRGREAVLQYSPLARKVRPPLRAREVLVVDSPAEREGCLWFRWAAICHLAGTRDLSGRRGFARSAVTI
jgi:hypothetical protein